MERTTTATEERTNKLAQANLCRLRGEYDRAEGLCVEILQENPDKVEAMAILGDLCAERNDLARAQHWYSMAADIEPPLPGVIDKCRQIERRIQAEEQSHSAVISIRAAYSRQRTATWIAVGGAFMALAAAFIVGMKKPAKPVASNPIIFSDSPAAPAVSQTPVQNQVAMGPTPIANSDLAILEKVNRPEIKNVISAWLDPRSNVLTIVATHSSAAPEANESSSLGIDGLQVFPNASMVTIRLMDQGSPVYIADVTRSDFTRVLPALSNPDPNTPGEASTADPTAILSNIWQQPAASQASNLGNSSGS